MADIAFVVFRSNSPTGPWEEVGVPEEGRFQFADFDVQSMNTSRNYYFIIRAVSKSGQGYRDSAPANPGHDPDHIAYELIRKKNLFLTVKSGIGMGVLLKKSWGAKCSRCFNAERQLPSDPDCPNCYGTGFSLGYQNPVYAPALFAPPKQAVIEAGIKYETGSTYLEFANYPFLGPGDVLVDLQSNIRYRAEAIGISTRRGYIVSQMVNVIRVDENDIIYTIPLPVPPHSPVERSFDMVERGADLSFAQKMMRQQHPGPPQ